MSMLNLFAAGVRLQLFELQPDWSVQTRSGERIEGHRWMAGVQIDHGKREIVLFTPSIPDEAHHIITTAFEWRSREMYCTAGEVVPLISAVVHLSLSAPLSEWERANMEAGRRSVRTWYTAAAAREHAAEIAEVGGELLDEGFGLQPRPSDLFNSPRFWSLLQRVRGNKNNSKTTPALADFVQKQGFHGLAQTLRFKPDEGLHLFPPASACPPQVRTCA
jgi:hypothetical protein